MDEKREPSAASGESGSSEQQLQQHEEGVAAAEKQEQNAAIPPSPYIQYRNQVIQLLEEIIESLVDGFPHG